MNHKLEVRLLGEFDIRLDGKTTTIASRPAQSLFAYLILSAGTLHRREKLAGLLWPDSLEEAARENLRHALWRMRKALEAASSTRFLHADDVTIGFQESPDYWLDAAVLGKLSENATADELITVLSNYQGELLPGFYDEWVGAEREHLQSVFEHHMARLLSLLQGEKRWLEILDWGERWIKLGQKPEPAYRALMSAHAAKGDMSKVAATYERCVKSLKEYGIEPSEQTRALYQKLKAGKETLETESIVQFKERRRESLKAMLPIPLTSFIGREKEVEAVVRMLSQSRLLTLTGPGGVGKTRLAVQVSNRLLDRFKNGVWWIDLAALTDDTLIPQVIAQLLGIRQRADQALSEAVKNFLREKESLLILDNCEHLIAACARIAQDLLGQCANLRILATSREALNIPGEIAYQVPTLSLPKPQRPTLTDSLMEYEGVQLFVERAASVQAGFALTQQNSLAVLQICQRLDGLPLALELAAARTKLLTVEHIAERLNDRFNLLTQGSRTALPRQQTLRATIDWSYDLLPEEARVLFRRLAVFAGGFTLEAVEGICCETPLHQHDALDLLTRLVDRSLVKVERQGEYERYRMLEMLGEYARERLNESGETEQLRWRHCDFFVAFAEKAEPKLKGPEQVAWLDRLDVEFHNLRLAWDWAIEADADLALSLASALLEFWFLRANPGEGREWLAKLLPRTEPWGKNVRRAHALNTAGQLAYAQRDFAMARSLLEEALPIARIARDDQEIALILLALGRTAHRRQDNEAAHVFALECLMIYQELRDSWGIALTTYLLAAVTAAQGNYAAAEKLYMESLRRFQKLEDRFRAGYVFNGLGELARLLGDYEMAGQYYEQAIEILHEQRSPVALVTPAVNLGWVLLQAGDYQKSQAAFEESLMLSNEIGNKNVIALSLGGFAGLLGMSGKPKEAAQLFGGAEALLDAIGIAGRMDQSDQKEFDRYVAIVRSQLDNETYARAWAEGHKMNLEQLIAFVLKGTQP